MTRAAGTSLDHAGPLEPEKRWPACMLQGGTNVERLNTLFSQLRFSLETPVFRSTARVIRELLPGR